MMTRHPVRPEQLPRQLREALPYEEDSSGRIIHPTHELRKAVFDWFLEALSPLGQAGKLGAVLLQFPLHDSLTPRSATIFAMRSSSSNHIQWQWSSVTLLG